MKQTVYGLMVVALIVIFSDFFAIVMRSFVYAMAVVAAVLAMCR